MFIFDIFYLWNVSQLCHVSRIRWHSTKPLWKLLYKKPSLFLFNLEKLFWLNYFWEHTFDVKFTGIKFHLVYLLPWKVKTKESLPSSDVKTLESLPSWDVKTIESYHVEMLKHKKVYQVEMFGDFVKKILSAAFWVQVELDGAAVQQGNVDNHCFQLKRKDQNTKFLY